MPVLYELTITLDKPMNNHRIYYTYATLNCGFTDNLQRFDTCYRFGLSLGYEYVHTPLNSKRSSNRIDKFVGFDDYFVLKISDLILEDYEIIKIDFYSIFKKRNIATLQDLQNFVREHVSLNCKFSKKIPLIFFTITKLVRDNLRIQKMLSQGLKESHLSVGLDYRSIYFQARTENPRNSRFVDNKAKMLVHIRQGDIAIIETPWETYIPLRKLHDKQNKIAEIKDRKKIGNEYRYVDDFYLFIERFFNFCDRSDFSVIISSDGYKRAFKKFYKNKHRFKMTGKQLRILKNTENSYDQNKFAQFSQLDNCLCLIGETDENLFDLIHSSLIADIIVFGIQQRMIKKLLSFYADVDNPPILIMLHRLKKLDGYAFEEMNVKVIPVNLDKMDIESFVTRVRQEIKNKTQFHMEE